jgi:negative regulator of sigma E activity
LIFKNILSTRLCAGLALSYLLSGSATLPKLQSEGASEDLIHRIDLAVHARDEAILAYTVTEHYAVFKDHDEQHAAADMVVKTTYRKDEGKTFSVVSESGSELLRKVLENVLDNEKRMTQPANRRTVVITSANYEMNVKGSDPVNGRDCVALALQPKRSSPYLFRGTVWVDARDGSIVQLEGVTAKAPSVFTGPSQVFRQYAPLAGFSMATHARAVSHSWLLGQIIVKIDYSGYQIKNRGAL